MRGMDAGVSVPYATTPSWTTMDRHHVVSVFVLAVGVDAIVTAGVVADNGGFPVGGVRV